MQLPAGIKISKSHRGKGLFAAKPIGKGTAIFHFKGRLGSDAQTNPESLQIDEDLFLESTAKYDDYLNHSCEPNCHIDWEGPNLVSLGDISCGAELTIDYNTAELDLINMEQNCSFRCHCGSKGCYGKVKGFRYLSEGQQKKISSLLSPFLKKKYNSLQHKT